MDSYQKEQIIELRKSGETCAKIADTLGLSVNTVKSFCRRNNINATPKIKAVVVTEAVTESSACPQCGDKITQINGRKPKRFCSDDCRVTWWNANTKRVKRKAVYSFICAYCNQDFTAYGNANRRYCSHSCYCKNRFSRSAADGEAVTV